MKYDFLVVGAGLSGAVFAREAADAGRRVLVVERRAHVAGNCHTESHDGIQVHRHGPHLFHTASRGVWDYVRRFAEFRPYRHTCKALFRGRLYSFPINLLTLHQLWGVTTPEEARARLDAARVPIARPANLEEWALSQVGPELYETFIRGYTAKQWARDPRDLPASIVRRLPIRLTFEDRYFPDHDRYEGVPVGGYTPLVERMLDSVEVRLGVDFLADRARLTALADRVVYTGPLDALGDYRFGYLDYRSLRFEQESLPVADFQGGAIVNYTERSVPHTRITEWKHIDGADTPHTVITREYPTDYTGSNEPYYPVNTPENEARRRLYVAAVADVLLCGRLATYRYLDMDMCVGQALALARRALSGGATP